VGLLNHSRTEFGEEFSHRLNRTLQDALSLGEHNNAKICLRLLAELTNAFMLPVESLTGTLSTLLNGADTAEDQNGKDFYLWLVCSTIPWAHELTSGAKEEAAGLLSRVDEIFDARPKVTANLSPLATIGR